MRLYRTRTVTIIRSVCFALLGIIFLAMAAYHMETSNGRLVFAIFGVLDLLYAGWIASALRKLPKDKQ